MAFPLMLAAMLPSLMGKGGGEGAPAPAGVPGMPSGGIPGMPGGLGASSSANSSAKNSGDFTVAAPPSNPVPLYVAMGVFLVLALAWLVSRRQ